MCATHLLAGLSLALGAAAVIVSQRQGKTARMAERPIDYLGLDHDVRRRISDAIRQAQLPQVEEALVRRATPFAMAARGPSFRRN